MWKSPGTFAQTCRTNIRKRKVRRMLRKVAIPRRCGMIGGGWSGWSGWMDVSWKEHLKKWLGWLFYLSWHVFLFFTKKNEMDSRNCWACTRTLVIGDWLVGKCRGLKEMWFHEESAHIFSFKILLAFPVSLAKKCVLHEQCQNPSFGLV